MLCNVRLVCLSTITSAVLHHCVILHCMARSNTSSSAFSDTLLEFSVTSPKYTMVLMCFLVLGRVFSSKGNFWVDVKTVLASAWSMMYSTELSPSESYRGTASRSSHLHTAPPWAALYCTLDRACRSCEKRIYQSTRHAICVCNYVAD